MSNYPIELSTKQVAEVKQNIILKTTQVAFSHLIRLRLGLKTIKQVRRWEDRHPNVKMTYSVQDFAYYFCWDHFSDYERSKILYYSNFREISEEESLEWYNLITKMDDLLTEFLTNN